MNDTDLHTMKLRMELEYSQRMEKYNHHVRMLEFEKGSFIANNPDFPKEILKLMFLNVIAPPQKIQIIEVH